MVCYKCVSGFIVNTEDTCSENGGDQNCEQIENGDCTRCKTDYIISSYTGKCIRFYAFVKENCGNTTIVTQTPVC